MHSVSFEFEELRFSGEKLLSELNTKFEQSLDYNAQTVTWLDDYISKIRDSLPEERIEELGRSIGYIIGQSIIVEYGGSWQFNHEFNQWVVNIGKPVGIANPIGKASKYLVDYLDSVDSFFQVIKMVKEKGDWNIGRKGNES
ncbi:MAG: hypothetical protein J0M11_16770 [Anaerolineae bacterium]|nr:hypothetical protein [Anaerolineae bacterium]